MKKKILSILLSMVLISTIVFAHVACGEECDGQITLMKPMNVRTASASLYWDFPFNSNWNPNDRAIYVEIKTESVDNDTYYITTVRHPTMQRIAVPLEDLNVESGTYRLSVRMLGFVYSPYRTYLDSEWSIATYTVIGLPQEPENLRWYDRLINERYNQFIWALGSESRAGFPYRHRVRIKNSYGEVIFTALAEEHRTHFNFPLYSLLTQDGIYTVGVQAVTKFGFGRSGYPNTTWYFEGSTSNFVEKRIVLADLLGND